MTDGAAALLEKFGAANACVARLLCDDHPADDLAFTDRLAELGALVLPGGIVECPGWFRISLTASDEMVERGLEAFRRRPTTG